VGYFFLAAACFARAPWLIAFCLAVGAFSDERVATSAPLLYLLQSDSPITQLSLRDLLRLNHMRVGTIAGALFFAGVRIIFGMHVGHLVDRAEVGFYKLLPNLLMLPVNSLFVFKGTVLILALALLVALLRRAGVAILIVAVAAFPSVVASMLVTDISRSLAYVFPLLLICTQALTESMDLLTIRRVALCAALFSTLIPTSFIWVDTLLTYRPLPFIGLQRLVSLIHFPH
jgi:hypothetical protein